MKIEKKENELRKFKSIMVGILKGEVELLFVLYLNVVYGFYDGNNNLLIKCFYWIAFIEEVRYVFLLVCYN